MGFGLTQCPPFRHNLPSLQARSLVRFVIDYEGHDPLLDRPSMGDRTDRSRLSGGMGRPWLQLRRPPEIMTWGLPARIGHNNGPPLEEPPPDIYVRYKWRQAHAAAWKTPSMSILKFRVARAEAAGVSYHAYMLELLDTGRHLQAADTRSMRPSPKTASDDTSD